MVDPAGGQSVALVTVGSAHPIGGRCILRTTGDVHTFEVDDAAPVTL